MKPDDLARAIREGAGTFRIDKVAVADTAGTVKFRGTGIFRITSDGITGELALRGKAQPSPKRVLTEKDYWKLRGVIAGDLPFSSAYITPIGWLGGPKQTCVVTRTLHAIELITTKVDPIRIRSRNRARYRRLNVTPPPRSKPGTDRSFLFEAIIVDHPLPGANEATEKVRTNPFLPESKTISGDTFLGETSHAEYALIRAANDRDLELYFRSKPDWKSPGEQDDRRKFDALLHAMAFCSGVQPWPYRTTYSRGKGFVFSDTLNAATPPPRTVFIPLRVNFGKQPGAELANAIGRAAEFFREHLPSQKKCETCSFFFGRLGQLKQRSQA